MKRAHSTSAELFNALILHLRRLLLGWLGEWIYDILTRVGLFNVEYFKGQTMSTGNHQPVKLVGVSGDAEIHSTPMKFLS